MRLDLYSATDAGYHVLFDLGSLPAEFDISNRNALEKEFDQGNMLVFDAQGSGDILLRLYLDEEPEKELRERSGGKKVEGLLRVPSGTLFFAGCEYLPTPEELTQPESFQLSRPYMGTVVSIPSGNYKLEAFLPNWSGKIIDEERGRLLGPVGNLVEKIIGPITGFAFVALLFGLPGAALIAWLDSGWPALWAVLLYGGIPVIIFVVAGFALLTVGPVGKRMKEVSKALESKYPGGVLILARLPHDVDTRGMKGCKLDPDHFLP